ncbi:TPA: acyltransferase family protein [Streptococcus suis]|nr:acyltransferase family protein [Streptococcus suis]
MIEQKANRNFTIDILRGIAMMLVVLGHTMTGSTINAESSLLFSVIWTLQMPLFILISGYVNKYSKPLTSGKVYGKFVCKKTFTYLIPWIIWTFLIRGLIFEQTLYLNVKYILFHMDTGYWFLVSLWTMVMFYGLSQFISELICSGKNKFTKLMVFTLGYVIGMAILASIGFAMGLSFFSIKLTLYYMPFYFLGYLFGQLDVELFEYKYGNQIKEIVIAGCFIGWIALMIRFNFYSIGDGEIGIILRALASIMGCIAVCGFASKLFVNEIETEKVWKGIDSQYRDTLSRDISGSFWKNSLSWVGQHSLEIYLLHSFTLNLLQNQVKPMFFNFCRNWACGCELLCNGYIN